MNTLNKYEANASFRLASVKKNQTLNEAQHTSQSTKTKAFDNLTSVIIRKFKLGRGKSNKVFFSGAKVSVLL